MNDLKIRIKKYEKGFVVEKMILKSGFFSNSFEWISLINYRGTNDPFFFHSYDSALNNLIIELKQDILSNSV